MVDVKDELLIALLGCGYADIKTMTDIMEMGEELIDENPIEKVINRDDITFDGILYDAMEYITYNLAIELDQEDRSHIYCDILDEYWSHPYVNYMDSHFQIECLDDWVKGSSKDRLLEELKTELLAMKEKGDQK